MLIVEILLLNITISDLQRLCSGVFLNIFPRLNHLLVQQLACTLALVHHTYLSSRIAQVFLENF